MIEGIIIGAGGTVGAAILIGLFGKIREKVEQKSLKGDVALLYEINFVQLGALRALLEATQGHCNGNIEEALKKVKGAQDKSQKYLSGKIEGAA